MRVRNTGRPALKVGGRYRNAAGQVREITDIHGNLVTFRVVDPGPDGPATFGRLLMDHQYQNLVRSFEGWAVWEVPA